MYTTPGTSNIYIRKPIVQGRGCAVLLRIPFSGTSSNRVSPKFVLKRYEGLLVSSPYLWPLLLSQFATMGVRR